MSNTQLGGSVARRVVSAGQIAEEVAEIRDQAERLGVTPLPPDELAQLAVQDYRMAGVRVTGDLNSPDVDAPKTFPPTPKE